MTTHTPDLLERYRRLSRGLGEIPFHDWSSRFATTDRDPWIDGSFALHPTCGDWDLYGLVDMLLCGITLEPSLPMPRGFTPQRWADRILSCLDGNGMATRRNHTLHVPEHATAYAYAGLVLLSNRGARIDPPPLRYFSSATFDEAEFTRWFDRMGWEVPRWVPGKSLRESLRISARRLGWLRFWTGSHVVGGMIATLVMREQLAASADRRPPARDLPELESFFRLADRRIDPRTGLWRPRFKRLASRHGDLADVGGAAHFLWLYDRAGVPHPRPEPMLRTVLRLQRPDGSFMRRPGCIDLDCTHLLSYASRLGAGDPDEVDRAMTCNGLAVLERLLGEGGLRGYGDSHGPPGAFCALAQVDAYLRRRGLESGRSPTFDVLSEVCWI